MNKPDQGSLNLSSEIQEILFSDNKDKVKQDEKKEEEIPFSNRNLLTDGPVEKIETNKQTLLKPILKNNDVGFLDKTVDLNPEQSKYLSFDIKENQNYKPEIKLNHTNFEVDIENEQVNNEKINSNFGLLCSINQAPSTDKVFFFILTCFY